MELLKSTVADGANRILRNTKIAVSLKYLSNFWRSLGMNLINNKVELKHQWTKRCVLAAAGGNNTNANSDNIIFTIKNTEMFVPVVTLSAKGNRKLSKLRSKGLERSIYWYEYKTKRENRNTTNKYKYQTRIKLCMSQQILVYLSQDYNVKRYKARRYYLPKGVFENHNVINGKRFYDQPIDPDVKRFEELRKLTTGGEDYTPVCLLNYDYNKNHYRVITVDLSRQKELDTDSKAIKQIQFIGQLKRLDNNRNATDADVDQSMLFVKILEKINETRLKFSQGSVTVL